MCMFSRPVYRVSNTEILVMASGSRQVTVYGNRVALLHGAPTAMILPVPCSDASRAAASIAVMDMSAAGQLFEALSDMFPSTQFGFGRARGLEAASYSANATKLAVHRSGSYRYSIVPRLDDFARLQHEVFGIEPSSELAAVFRTHYADGFAFLACIIDRDAHFTPIAYAHDMHANGRVFVPTRHYHGPRGGAGVGVGGQDITGWSGRTLGGHGDLAYSSSAAADLTRSGTVTLLGAQGHGHASDVETDWDHAVYSIGCVGATSVAGAAADVAASSYNGYVPLAESLRAHHVTLPFAVPYVVATSLLRKRAIKGSHANTDLWLTPDALLRGNTCTTLVTGNTYAEQDFFTCTTCNLGRGEGVCGACARTCHANHATMFAGRTSCFCDCGTGTMAAGGVRCACK